MDDRKKITERINELMDGASLKALRLLLIVAGEIVSVKGKQSE